jgi:hypothetical protein
MKARSLLLLLVSAACLIHAEEFTGWLSDAKCAAAGKGASSDHAACAKKCVEGGEAVVLVTADNKVYKIKNQEPAKRHVGQKVTIEGKLDGDTIEVQSGRPAE